MTTIKRILIRKLKDAEVSTGESTHEIYIRIPNDFNYEEFFQYKEITNQGPTQINFRAIDLTPGFNKEILDLKFVHYNSEKNKENRIPSLRDLFESRKVHTGTIVYLESTTTNNNTTFYIKFIEEVEYLSTNSDSICYTYISDNNEVANKEPLQQIIYGAPGTGKSFSVNRIIAEHAGLTEKDENGKYIIPKDILFRTTFHPDYDYAQFVGCYKPVKKDGDLTYEFVSQVFTDAYKTAWANPKKQIYLVIEEINRGYCAQIFGDLFQLLDRDENGYSEYGIKPDKDLKEHLEQECSAGIIAGEMKIPYNLNIIATMNTSDQNLCPMDSAFKRRWDWVYEPIDHTDARQFYVKVAGDVFNWDDIITYLNEKIYAELSSPDKQLGNRFLKFKEENKQKDHPVDEDIFVNKVLFYLWNEVYKDEEDSEVFEDIQFDDLYGANKDAELKKIMQNIFKNKDGDHYNELKVSLQSNQNESPTVAPAEERSEEGSNTTAEVPAENSSTEDNSENGRQNTGETE